MPNPVLFDGVEVGDAIPELMIAPVDRAQLAHFADVGGDRNPIHSDDQAAKDAGLSGVIAPGMLNMAFLGRLLTQWAPQHALRGFSTRFSAMVYPGDTLTCTGTVKAKTVVDGERLVDLELRAHNQHGKRILLGKARVALS